MIDSVPSPKTSDLSQYINPAANEKAAKAIRAHYGQVPADKYKTVMCQTWLDTAKCRFGARCKFAHGESELRSNKLASPRRPIAQWHKLEPMEEEAEKKEAKG